MILLIMNNNSTVEIDEAIPIREILHTRSYQIYDIAELIASDISLQRIRALLKVKNDAPRLDKVSWFGSDAQFIAGNLGIFEL